MTHSIPDRGASGPAGIRGAVEPAVGDPDQFDRTPRSLLDELVTHAAELADRLRGQPRALVVDFVGQPLVMQARRIDRLLRRHSVIVATSRRRDRKSAQKAALRGGSDIADQEDGMAIKSARLAASLAAILAAAPVTAMAAETPKTGDFLT